MQRDNEDPMLLILALPELPEGVYSVNWRILSEADGHFTQGLLVFGVGQGADLGSISTSNQQVSVPLAEVILRWLRFSFMALLLGTFIIRSLIIGQEKTRLELRPTFTQACRRLEGLAFGASIILFFVGFGLLVFQMTSLLATLPESVSYLSALRQLAFNTRWGKLWMIWQADLLALFGLL